MQQQIAPCAEGSSGKQGLFQSSSQGIQVALGTQPCPVSLVQLMAWNRLCLLKLRLLWVHLLCMRNILGLYSFPLLQSRFFLLFFCAWDLIFISHPLISGRMSSNIPPFAHPSSLGMGLSGLRSWYCKHYCKYLFHIILFSHTGGSLVGPCGKAYPVLQNVIEGRSLICNESSLALIHIVRRSASCGSFPVKMLS